MKILTELEKLHNKYVVRKEKIIRSKKVLNTYDTTRCEVLEEVIDDLSALLSDAYSQVNFIKIQ